MVVKPLIRITNGWKHDEKKRFGSVVVGVFETYNAETNAVKVFHFAPTLNDIPLIRRLCEMVEEVDKHNKAVYNLQQEALKIASGDEVCSYEK